MKSEKYVLSFKKITLEDKEVITAYTYAGSYYNCDYAFANMCSWNFLYNSEYAISNDFLFIDFISKIREINV